MKYAWPLVFVVQLCSHGAFANEQCGSIQNAYGPYDYRVDKDKLGIVEVRHFTRGVQNLTERSTSPFGGDLDYTLRAIPNHPHALMSMLRLAEKTKSERPEGTHYSVECYFDRALRFRPNDGMVRMIYANYLTKHGRSKEAQEQLEMARDMAGENANLNYNLALAYFDLREYDKALTYAHKAYAMGFTLPGLRNKLQKAGKWREATSEELAAMKVGSEEKSEASGPAEKSGAADSAKPAPIQPQLQTTQ